MLVVDDDAVIAVMLQRYFTTLGFAVDEAISLEQALERAVAAEYVLVLSDLRMGGGGGREGLEVVRFVRARSSNTGIIVLTAYADPQIIADAKGLGADRVHDLRHRAHAQQIEMHNVLFVGNKLQLIQQML